MPVLSETQAPKPADPRWSDLRARTVSALVLAPLAIFCAWQGGLTWDLFIGVAMAGLAWEWGRLAGSSAPWPVIGFILALWADAIISNVPAALLVMPIAMLFLWRMQNRFTAFGVPYIMFGGLALIWLRCQPAGLADTVFLVLTVWGTDVGAYLTGRLVGGPKIAPLISPGKTWAGSLGGLLMGAAAAAMFAGGGKTMPLAAFAAGLLLSFCAQGGDLLESAIKRKLGVKDSGHAIPGHGGLFDRLDGFLAAAPVAALLALCMQGGVPLWG